MQHKILCEWYTNYSDSTSFRYHFCSTICLLFQNTAQFWPQPLHSINISFQRTFLRNLRAACQIRRIRWMWNNSFPQSFRKVCSHRILLESHWWRVSRDQFTPCSLLLCDCWEYSKIVDFFGNFTRQRLIKPYDLYSSLASTR